MFRLVFSALLLGSSFAPAALCAQTRARRPSTAASRARPQRTSAAPKKKQAPRNLQETYHFAFGKTLPVFVGQTALQIEAKNADGSSSYAPYYEYATDREGEEVSLGGELGSIEIGSHGFYEPPVAPLLLSSGHLVVFADNNNHYLENPTFRMVVLASATRPHPMYFIAADIDDATLPGVDTFFCDPYLFTPGTSAEVYTRTYNALYKKITAREDNVNVETSREAIKEKLRRFVANTFNDVIYNPAIDLFNHPIIKKTPLPVQVVRTYKAFQQQKASMSVEERLYTQRMINRECLVYMMPRASYPPPQKLFTERVMPKEIAWKTNVTAQTRKAVEEDGQIVLYDRDDKVIARFASSGLSGR